jgi:triacylglycerol lipase
MTDPLVHPSLRAALAKLPDFGTISYETLHQVRAFLPDPPAADDDGDAAIAVERIAIPSDPDVSAILYRPVVAAAGSRPALLNIHGGGFIAGSAAREDANMRRLAHDLDVVILSVDYRLAPETPYPGPLDDCFAALLWLRAQADVLGVDPARIAVRGVSAGGGLAAGLSLYARDRGGPDIGFLLLVYPMLDDRTVKQPFAGRHVWPIAANRFGWQSYLGRSADVSAYAAPARADDLTGLPPTFIATGSIDLFAEEDIAYASALIRAGVPVELHVYPGAYHGFDMVVKSAAARAFLRDENAALHHAFTMASPAATYT